MASIVILTGEQKGQKFEIDRDRVVVGRSHENVICIDSPSVSGKHCAITRDGRKFTVQDLDSTNGTRLNDVKIKEYRLSPKDIITTGDIQMKFDGDDVEAPDARKSDAIADTQITVRLNTSTKRQIIGTTSIPFKKKKDSKVVWILLLAVAIIAAVVAGVWFMLKLFASTSA